MAKQRILIVDDEEDICMILSYSLQKAGYETLVAHSAEEALELLQSPIANDQSPHSPYPFGYYDGRYVGIGDGRKAAPFT